MAENLPLLQERKVDFFHQKHQHIYFGYFCLTLLIFIWVIQSEVTQYVQTAEDFNRPFMITSINHISSIIILPGVYLWYVLFLKKKNTRSFTHYLGETYDNASMHELSIIAIKLAAAFLACDYFWYTALANTSVTDGTVIINSSCVFVYCFSVLLLNDVFVSTKVAGVISSIVGVMCVALWSGEPHDLSSDPAHGHTRLIADIFVLIASIVYGGYEVAARMWIGSHAEQIFIVFLITGLSGFYSLIPSFFGSIIMNYVNEPFVLPSAAVWPSLLLNGLLAAIFNVLLMLSVSLTSPLTVSIGCILTIPLSALCDYIFHGDTVTTGLIGGTFFICIGFMLTSIDEFRKR